MDTLQRPASRAVRVQRRRPPPRWRRVLTASVLVPLSLGCLAGGLRLWRLSQPATMYADEAYYANDAYAYLGGGYGIKVPGAPRVTINDEGTWVHPPLGKWMIALGEGPLGFRPLGWRLPSALSGTAAVLLVYALALVLWGSVWWAGLAGLLLAVDGLHVVNSRVAMLDGFLTTFIVAGVLSLALDRAHMAGGPRTPGSRLDRTFGSRYRFGAGLMFGAAVATKWSGLYALALAGALCAAWLLRGPGRGTQPAWRQIGTLVAAFVLLPILVYLASYASFFLQHGLAVRDFLLLQARMLQHNLHYDRVVGGSSSPLSWPLLLHPPRYYPTYGTVAPPGDHRIIVGMGNPVLWWGFLILVPVLLWRLAQRREWQLALIVGGYLAIYLPWLPAGRTEFLFYLLPAVPFMCLGVVAAVRSFGRRSRGAGLAVGAAAVLAATVYLPLWLGFVAPHWMGGVTPSLR